MSDKWIQNAVDDSHEGYCTPITKSTCTPRRKALAKRFKKGGDLYSGNNKNSKKSKSKNSKTKNESMLTMDALEILAVSDPATFESLIKNVGLQVEGRINDDPLEKQVQTEAVVSIASELTENANDYVDVDDRILECKKLAEDYGYIVSIV